MATTRTPSIGNVNFAIQLFDGYSGGLTLCTLGLSDTVWGGGALPFPLGGGCDVLVDPLMALLRPITGTGPGDSRADLPLGVPNSPALVGGDLFTQWITVDPAAANRYGLVTTGACGSASNSDGFGPPGCSSLSPVDLIDPRAHRPRFHRSPTGSCLCDRDRAPGGADRCAHRTAIVIFAFWPDWSSGFEELRRLALAEALATWPIPSDPGLRYGGRGGRRRSTIRGFCRAEYEIDGEAIQLDIDVGLFGNAIQVTGSKRPSPLEVSGDQAWGGGLVLRAATDELPSKQLLVNVTRSAKDGNPLIGVVSKVSETADEIEVERLPYPVRFARR